MQQYCQSIKGPQRPNYNYNWSLAVPNASSTTQITNNFKVEFDGDISVTNKDANTVALKFNAYPPVLPVSTVVSFSYNNSLLDATHSTNLALGGNGLAVPGYVTGANVNVTAFPDGYLMYSVPYSATVKDFVAKVSAKAGQVFDNVFDVRCVLLKSSKSSFPVFCPIADLLVGKVAAGASDPTLLLSNQKTDINCAVTSNDMLMVLFYSNSSTKTYSFNVTGSISVV